MGIKMAVAFANIFMARIENVTSHRYFPTPNISFSPSSLHLRLGADVNLQKVEGGLWKSTNSDESGYVNFSLL